MTVVAKARAQLARATPSLVDPAVAVVLTAGALVDVALLRRPSLPALTIALAVACTSTVAWRRRLPVAAALVALAAIAAYQLSARDPRLTFEPVAVALTFYTAARHATAPRRRRSAALLAAALVAFGIVASRAGGAWLPQTAGSWLLFAVLPSTLGLLVARRSAMARELAAQVERLQHEQRARAERAAGEERQRVARELHDIVAHCVSVMVIQSAAARLMLGDDVAAARAALAAVESCGREAMAELRRLVGALGRQDAELAAPVRGLSRLEALVQRASAAGTPTRLRITGELPPLSPELELLVYRIVQEALTNVVKHAGPATADVELDARDGTLELVIADDGEAQPAETGRAAEQGYGLIGMRERVAVHGGQVDAGPRPGGGFAVRARIPIAAAEAASRVAPPDAAPAGNARRVLRGDARVVDGALAAAWLVALVTEAMVSPHRRGPLAVDVAVVAAMAVAGLWRRRAPLRFLIVVGLLAIPLSHGLTSRDAATLTGLYTVLVPSYAVGAWSERPRATLWLAAWGCVATAIGVFEHAPLGGIVGPLLAATAAWSVGRVMRSQRELAARLRETSARLAAERDDRARLAVVGERTRIARDLHALVAHDVIAMVVQAEAAQSLLDTDPERARTAAAAIEQTGRQALARVRRILGVLRTDDPRGRREPQPGLGQIHALVERAREHGQPVELTIAGDPGHVDAGVGVTAYRILEDVLAAAASRPDDAVAVSLRFDEEIVQLALAADGGHAWPIPAIRSRVAFCQGRLDLSSDDGRARLVVRLPCEAQGVPA